MAKDYLRLDGGRYCFRRRVPAVLVGIVGKAELAKTIGHCDHREAQRRARRLIVASDRFFMTVGSNPSLSQAEIEDLAQGWFRDALDEEERLVASLDFDDPKQHESELRHARKRAEGARDLLRRNDWTAASSTADDLLRENGITLSPDSASYLQLCHFLLRGVVQITRQREGRLDGTVSP
jgi:hypothetical protein